MNFSIIYGKNFVKHYSKLSTKEQKLVDSKLELLISNPAHPSLRTKRIQGAEHLFEASVNMDIRIIWKYENDSLILLLDIGHHDILNQF